MGGFLAFKKDGRAGNLQRLPCLHGKATGDWPLAQEAAAPRGLGLVGHRKSRLCPVLSVGWLWNRWRTLAFVESRIVFPKVLLPCLPRVESSPQTLREDAHTGAKLWEQPR